MAHWKAMRVEKYEVWYTGGLAMVAGAAIVSTSIWFPVNATYLAVMAVLGVILFAGVIMEKLMGRKGTQLVVFLLVLGAYSTACQMFSGDLWQGGCMMLAVYGSFTWLFLLYHQRRIGKGVLADQTKNA